MPEQKIPYTSFRKQSAIFLLIVLVLGVNGWILYSKFADVSKAQRWTTRTYNVINEVEHVLSSLKDAETGARGFLLTNDEAYLEPYKLGTVAVLEHFSRLQSLTIDNKDRQLALQGLKMLVDQRLAILNRLTDPTIRSSTKHMRAFLDSGRTTMDTIRDRVEAMKRDELRLLEERRQTFLESQTYFRWALFITTMASILFLGAVFVQFRRNELRRQNEMAEREQESWIRTNMSRASISVAGDLGLKEVADNFFHFLAEEVKIFAARLFVVEDNQFRLITEAGIAAEESRTEIGQNIPVQRGLLGQAIQRNELWLLKPIPEEYWHIGSSLGSSRPHEVAFIPFSFQGRNIGIIELACFSPFTNRQLQLLERLREVIGVGINAAKTRMELQDYIEKMQQQAEELQTQQEELRSNNEELEQQARALESHQQTMALKNRELEQARRELELRAADLLKSNQYKSEFLAKMSHELRTPLNGLLILSTLLIENKQGNLTEQQKQFARSINTAGNDLLMLINDILDLSKIEAKKLQVRPEEFTVDDLLNHKLANFKPQADSKGLKFKVDVAPELKNQILETDRFRLEQILRNFLSNAIKFTETGSITLAAEPYGARMIEFSVQDTGIGIPESKKNLIFEAFEQADGSVSRKFGGTGLGLTISRELASLLQGEIDLVSKEGDGSTFYLRIPRRLQMKRTGSRPQKIEAAPMEPKTSPETTTDPQETSAIRAQLDSLQPTTKTILIVEDDPKFRLSVAEVVKSYGYQALEADTAEMAISMLEEHTPGAILLDIKLPGMSGLGFLEMIKHTPSLRHIPVHMISALDFQHNALRMGAMGYLSKPVTMEKIKAAMDRIETVMSQKVRKVLLIEDDQIQTQALSELIAGNDVQVKSVHNGADAIQLLKDQQFDCIILDLSLPDVSGFDVLSELSTLNQSLPPVVIYTGKDLSPEEEEHLRKYSESIIIKGARSPGRLLDEVNLFLHRMENLLPDDKQKILSATRRQDDSFDGKTVLVVDDDLRNVFALTSALESKGLNVEIAKNGYEALEALAKENSIDLVLMDIMMPKMDGLEATRRIRASKDQRIRDIPIIALTAKAMREDHEKCIEAGATDYLPKPVNLSNLTTLLKVWLAPKDLF